VELDDYLRVKIDDCHSKKADRKLRHIQATNAAGIGNVFKRVSCRAKVLPSTQQLLTRHRIIGSQVRALPGTVPQLQRLTDKTCSNRNEVLATF
jgi:hypothetical protein